jgi:hypothetical protein
MRVLNTCIVGLCLLSATLGCGSGDPPAPATGDDAVKAEQEARQQAQTEGPAQKNLPMSEE